MHPIVKLVKYGFYLFVAFVVITMALGYPSFKKNDKLTSEQLSIAIQDPCIKNKLYEKMNSLNDFDPGETYKKAYEQFSGKKREPYYLSLDGWDLEHAKESCKYDATVMEQLSILKK